MTGKHPDVAPAAKDPKSETKEANTSSSMSDSHKEPGSSAKNSDKEVPDKSLADSKVKAGTTETRKREEEKGKPGKEEKASKKNIPGKNDEPKIPAKTSETRKREREEDEPTSEEKEVSKRKPLDKDESGSGERAAADNAGKAKSQVNTSETRKREREEDESASDEKEVSKRKPVAEDSGEESEPQAGESETRKGEREEKEASKKQPSGQGVEKSATQSDKGAKPSEKASETAKPAYLKQFGGGGNASWDDFAEDDDDKKKVPAAKPSTPKPAGTPTFGTPSKFGSQFQSELGTGLFSSPGGWKASGSGMSFAELARSGSGFGTPSSSGTSFADLAKSGSGFGTPSKGTPLSGTPPPASKGPSFTGSFSSFSQSTPGAATSTPTKVSSTTGSSGGFGVFSSTPKGPVTFASGSAKDSSSTSFASLLSTPQKQKLDKDQDSKDKSAPEGNDKRKDDGGPSKGSATLEEKEVITGEENERTRFQCRGKLFAMEEGGWKERGIGTMKVNVNKDDASKTRAVMRQDAVLHVILNARIQLPCTIRDEKFVELSVLETKGITRYLLKIGKKEVAQEFADAWNEAAEHARNV